MKVYLAGPINGCTDEECKDWREAAKRILPDTLDPMTRDYRGREDECFAEIVELDKEDILQAGLVLVNYDKPSVGTSMEILYAWERGIPVILVARADSKLSPWLRYHVSRIFHSFEDAFACLTA